MAEPQREPEEAVKAKDEVREAAEAVARAWKAHGVSPSLEAQMSPLMAPYMDHLIEVLER